MNGRVDEQLHRTMLNRFGSVHAENIPRLGPREVAVLGYPGSGKTIIANMLHILGLNYVYAVTERLNLDGTSDPVARNADYLRRLDAEPGTDPFRRRRPARLWPRFVKTPLPLQYFLSRPLYGVWSLVRDPRDSVYSYYRHLFDFKDDPGRQRAFPRWLTFPEWLASSSLLGRRPVDIWQYTYSGWLEHSSGFDRAAVTRFEDLKRDPVGTMAEALRVFGVEVAERDLVRAAELSSFERMRRHEEDLLVDEGRAHERGRLVRRGLVGEWREWMTPQLWAFFSDAGLISTARGFGYELSPPARPPTAAPPRSASPDQAR